MAESGFGPFLTSIVTFQEVWPVTLVKFSQTEASCPDRFKLDEWKGNSSSEYSQQELERSIRSALEGLQNGHKFIAECISKLQMEELQKIGVCLDGRRLVSRFTLMLNGSVVYYARFTLHY